MVVTYTDAKEKGLGSATHLRGGYERFGGRIGYAIVWLDDRSQTDCIAEDQDTREEISIKVSSVATCEPPDPPSMDTRQVGHGSPRPMIRSAQAVQHTE